MMQALFLRLFPRITKKIPLGANLTGCPGEIGFGQKAGRRPRLVPPSGIINGVDGSA